MGGPPKRERLGGFSGKSQTSYSWTSKMRKEAVSAGGGWKCRVRTYEGCILVIWRGVSPVCFVPGRSPFEAVQPVAELGYKFFQFTFVFQLVIPHCGEVLVCP